MVSMPRSHLCSFGSFIRVAHPNKRASRSILHLFAHSSYLTAIAYSVPCSWVYRFQRVQNTMLRHQHKQQPLQRSKSGHPNRRAAQTATTNEITNCLKKTLLTYAVAILQLMLLWHKHC